LQALSAVGSLTRYEQAAMPTVDAMHAPSSRPLLPIQLFALLQISALRESVCLSQMMPAMLLAAH
jgi:hypothetical protein